MISAVSIAVEGDSKAFLLDPTHAEQLHSEFCLTVGFCSKSEGIVFSHTQGLLSKALYLETAQLAEKVFHHFLFDNPNAILLLS
jgi:hypothetical protein